MKVKFCTLVLFQLLLFNNGFGQRFRAGFTVGLVATDIDGADTRDTDNDFSKLGISAGGIITTPLTKKSTLQLEMNFIQKGHLDKPDSLNNGYSKIALSYIEIPVLIRRHVYFTIRKKPVNKLDLEAGLSIGRMIDHTVIGSTNYKIYSSTELFNPYDVSLLIGADYNITKNIFFCLRYSNSVIPAIKKNTPNLNFITYTFNKGNNMVLLLSFKFVFGAVKQEITEPKKEEEE